MTTIAKYIYTIDSRRRSSGSTTDFNIQLSQQLQKKAKDSLFSVRVVSATVPFSFYQLSADINTLTATFNDGVNSKTVSVVIQPGNYTTSSVANALAAVLTTACQASAPPYTGFNPQLTFTYSAITGQDTFVMASPTGSITLRFDLNPTLGLFFGLSTSITLSNLAVQTSTKTAVANPVNRLYVRSGDLHQLGNREWIVETDTFSDILYHIPITTNQNTYIHYNETQESVFIIDEFINSFNLYLTTNLSYTPMDLRGLDWSITMYIEEIIRPTFQPILLSDFNQPIQPQVSEEQQKLFALRDQEVKKMEKYKQKLLKKIPDKNILNTIKDALLSKQSGSEDLPNQLPATQPVQGRVN